jgi:hypothetical protein
LSRKARFFSILGITLALILILLVLRAAREGDFIFNHDSPVVETSPLETQEELASLLVPPTDPPPPTQAGPPEPVPPTGTPPVSQATLQAIRRERPTATPLSAPSFRWPYVSPGTWRRWAIWTLAAAALLAYLAWRMRQVEP